MDHSGEAGDDVTTDGIRKFTDSFLAAELKPFLLSGKSLPDYPPPPPPYEVPETPVDPHAADAEAAKAAGNTSLSLSLSLSRSLSLSLSLDLSLSLFPSLSLHLPSTNTTKTAAETARAEALANPPNYPVPHHNGICQVSLFNTPLTLSFFKNF